MVPSLVAIYVAILSGARDGAGDSSERTPASFGGRVAREPAQMNVIDLSCWDRARPDEGERAVAARYVRLTGRACGAVRTTDVLSVVNATNGFEATVFASGAGLTTDYIPLARGANDVIIAFRNSPARRAERRVLLVR